MRVLLIIFSFCIFSGSTVAGAGYYPPIVGQSKAASSRAPVPYVEPTHPVVHLYKIPHGEFGHFLNQLRATKGLLPVNDEDIPLIEEETGHGLLGSLFSEGQCMHAIFPRIEFTARDHVFVAHGRAVRQVIQDWIHGDISVVRLCNRFMVDQSLLPTLSHAPHRLRARYYMHSDQGVPCLVTLDHEIKISTDLFFDEQVPLKLSIWKNVFRDNPPYARSGYYSFSIAIDPDSANILFNTYEGMVSQGHYSRAFTDHSSRGAPVISPQFNILTEIMSGRTHGKRQLSLAHVHGHEHSSGFLYQDPSRAWGIKSIVKGHKRIFEIHHFTDDIYIQQQTIVAVQALLIDLINGEVKHPVTKTFYRHVFPRNHHWIMDDLSECVWINQYTDLNQYRDWIIQKTGQSLQISPH